MSSILTNNLAKYLLQGLIVFALFKYVPKNPMSDKDILILTVIVILCYVVLENINTFYSVAPPLAPIQQETTTCNTTCSIDNTKHKIEGMQNTSVEESAQEESNEEESKQEESKQEESKKNVKTEEETNYKYDAITGTSYLYKTQKNPQAITVGSRAKDDVMKHETGYSYTDFNSLPINNNTGSFEYGYSMLPPERWYPTPPHPPVCVAEKQCPVCPVFTTGTNVELKEWDQTRRITPPDEINIKMIAEKLNSGR